MIATLPSKARRSSPAPGSTRRRRRASSASPWPAGEVAGALASDSLTEAGLEAGRFDGAAVETLLVDWSDVSHRLLLATATLGEVRRAGRRLHRRAALRRPSPQPGRRAGSSPRPATPISAMRAAASILRRPALPPRRPSPRPTGACAIEAAGLGAIEAGRFTAGRLTWTGGANAGLAVEVKRHARRRRILDLWRPAPSRSRPVTASWSRPAATSASGPAATASPMPPNFRGFPHMPGNDRALGYARAGAGNDGQDVADDDA